MSPSIHRLGSTGAATGISLLSSLLVYSATVSLLKGATEFVRLIQMNSRGTKARFWKIVHYPFSSTVLVLYACALSVFLTRRSGGRSILAILAFIPAAIWLPAFAPRQTHMQVKRLTRKTRGSGRDPKECKGSDIENGPHPLRTKMEWNHRIV